MLTATFTDMLTATDQAARGTVLGAEPQFLRCQGA
jgi:hypothetical protein